MKLFYLQNIEKAIILLDEMPIREIKRKERAKYAF